MVLLLSACGLKEEPATDNNAPGQPLVFPEKYLNTPQNADRHSLILYIDGVLSPDDSIALSDAGIIAMTGLFNMESEMQEEKVRMGLDKWFEAVLAEDVVLEDAAAAAAALSSVSRVQYNNIYYRSSDCIPHPVEPHSRLGVESVSHVGSISSVFNDPQLSRQWHYANNGNKALNDNAYAGGDVNVADVWQNLCTGDRSIIVAVIDEGVKYTHPDLRDNMWINSAELNGADGVDDDGNGYVDDVYGFNFVANGPITWDQVEWQEDGSVSPYGDVGHGTHCAGTIAAVNNNGLGVSGIAGGNGSGNGVRIMSCQIFSGGSGATGSRIARAIDYATDMGASVISCSFGYTAGSFTSDASYISDQSRLAEYKAIKRFESHSNNDVLTDGNIAIFAAGNDTKPYAGYPGAFAEFISVSAFGPDYLPTHYTNYGQGCNITAPGGEVAVVASKVTYEGEVLSTLPSEIHDRNKSGADYGYMQGTSMACPHVSGVVALGLSYAHNLGKKYSVSEFKNMILSATRDFDSRLTGTKIVGFASNPTYTIHLGDYLKKMGTGCIDAWQLMMKIEGIPTHVVATGKKSWLDLSDYFGSSSVNLTYLGLEVSDEARQSMAFAEEPELKYGRLYVHPTKMGSCKITVRAIAGGTSLGGGSNPTGGMEMSQEVSIISRPDVSSNGSWF